MSVCVERNSFNNNQFSQKTSTCENTVKLTSTDSQKMTVFKQINIYLNKSRQRKALAALDDSLLADIGYSKAQAQEESNKPFWR